MTRQHAPAAAPRFVVDPWDPGYAAMAEAGIAGQLPESDAQLQLDVEVPAARWVPIPPAGPAAGLVQFVDGVRRIDARVWFLDDAQAQPGIAASYAAGVVTCDGAAEVTAIVVERGVFSASTRAGDIRTPVGEVYRANRAATADPDTLTAEMQTRMRELEIRMAREGALRPERVAAELMVIDGPLRGRENLPNAIGYVKTHQTAYLAGAQLAVVAALGPGERTPLFTVGSHWIRHTWYLRLPGPMTHPWAGVVRCECSAKLNASAARGVADLSAATLPRYASQPHKDGRAPQNLVPIAGLERQLRHRLGDRAFILRQLQRAQA